MTACAALALAAAGCQQYAPTPLTLESHRDEFLRRTADGASVRAAAVARAGAEARPLTFDPTDGLTCEEAEVIALAFNGDLRMARLRAGVTQAAAENAGLWEDPTLSVDLARIVETTPDPWKVFTTIGLTIPLSGRLEVEKRLAGVEHAAELARVAKSEWEVRLAVRRGWIEWSSLQARLVAASDFVSRADEILRVVDRLEQAGELARTEARLFRIERAARSADVALLQTEARLAELRLLGLMGLSPRAAVRFQGAESGAGESRGEVGSAAQENELALSSPAMEVVRAEYAAAENALELEIRQQYPDLHIGPGYGREDGQNQVLLGLSAPLPIFNANRRGIAETLARRDLARANAETTLERLLGTLHMAQARQDAAAKRRYIVETQLRPLVDDQYADARRIAQLGEVNVLVLLESLTRRHAAALSVIDARREEALAATEVVELLGPPARPGATERRSNTPPRQGMNEPTPPETGSKGNRP